MDYFWKENKKYLAVVGGALVVVFLYNSFVLSGFRKGAAAAERNLANERARVEKLLAHGEPGEDALNLARNERTQSKKQLATALEEMSFKVTDRFKRPASGVKDIVDNLRLNLPKELHDYAVKSKIACPVNIGVGDDLPEAVAEEVLLRLAAAEKVVKLAVDSRVEKIDLVNVMDQVDQKTEPVTRKGAFLNRYSILIKFSGTPEAVFKVLHGVQKKGSYLAVTSFALDRPNMAKRLLEASLQVAVLKLDEKSPVDPKN